MTSLYIDALEFDKCIDGVLTYVDPTNTETLKLN